MSIDWDGLVLAPLHAAFGETITYQPVGIGAPFTLTDAVCDRAYTQVGFDHNGVPVTAWSTHIGIRLASCPQGFAPADQDLVTWNGSQFRVVDQQPDGKGNIVLVMGVVS
jgi:hypothetical protein